VTLALVAALAAALLYGSGSVLQAVAARRSSGPGVLRHPWYVAGLACDLFGWLASLAALRALPLFTVQALLAGSLVVTVLLARVVLQARLRRVDGVAVAVVVASLVVLARAAGPDAAVRVLPGPFTAAVLAALALIAAACALAYRRGPGWVLAVLAGAAASGAAICARAVSVPAGGSGRGAALAGTLRAVAADPLAWSVAGFGLLTTVLYARALERAGVGASTAVLSVVEVVVPGVVGLAVLHDTVRPGWPIVAAVAAALALTACVTLATSPATTATATPARSGDPRGAARD
jgi:hypothetical protein